MPQSVEQPRESIPSPYRIRWTRADCEDFVERGLLTPGKFELIDGKILRKMGQKRPHSAGVGRLVAWCISIYSGDFVQSQASIDVAPEDNPTSEPEPDVFVLRRSIAYFPEAFPGPDDLLLVAEVSDPTLAFDLSTQAGLYARAGITEYWVVDVVGRTLTVHREPKDDRYEARVVVSQILPPLPIEE